jgi:membrane protein
MQAMPGAIFTTITWVLLTLAFRFYVDQFANYSRFYGALGALIALMIWLQLISTVLLLGVEVNAVLLSRRGIDLSGEPSRA